MRTLLLSGCLVSTACTGSDPDPPPAVPLDRDWRAELITEDPAHRARGVDPGDGALFFDGANEGAAGALYAWDLQTGEAALLNPFAIRLRFGQDGARSLFEDALSPRHTHMFVAATGEVIDLGFWGGEYGGRLDDTFSEGFIQDGGVMTRWNASSGMTAISSYHGENVLMTSDWAIWFDAASDTLNYQIGDEPISSVTATVNARPWFPVVSGARFLLTTENTYRLKLWDTQDGTYATLSEDASRGRLSVDQTTVLFADAEDHLVFVDIATGDTVRSEAAIDRAEDSVAEPDLSEGLVFGFPADGTPVTHWTSTGEVTVLAPDAKDRTWGPLPDGPRVIGVGPDPAAVTLWRPGVPGLLDLGFRSEEDAVFSRDQQFALIADSAGNIVEIDVATGETTILAEDAVDAEYRSATSRDVHFRRIVDELIETVLLDRATGATFVVSIIPRHFPLERPSGLLGVFEAVGDELGRFAVFDYNTFTRHVLSDRVVVDPAPSWNDTDASLVYLRDDDGVLVLEEWTPDGGSVEVARDVVTLIARDGLDSFAFLTPATECGDCDGNLHLKSFGGTVRDIAPSVMNVHAFLGSHFAYTGFTDHADGALYLAVPE